MNEHIDIDADAMQSIGSIVNNITAKSAPDGVAFHEPGIYFGLSDEIYHADPALGSTGLKKLLSSAPDFWWQSSMNPAREPETDTPSKIFGRAVHRCVLEGRDAFEADYGPAPTPEEFPGCLRVTDDIKAFLEKAGLPKSGNKDVLIARAKEVSGCPIVFDDEVAAFSESGKIPLKREDYNRILAASAFIGANPHVAGAFQNGMPEVSVFWERDGVRMKARLDFLKMNAITDLKSIRNPLGKEFRKACRDRIAELDYTLSAEQYMEGRRQMGKLVAAGRVFGDHDRDWLRKVAANDVFAFVLVFWQAEGAPISHGFKLSPGNPLFAYARQSIAQAVHNYQTYLKQFGANTAWVLAEPLDELDETDLPVWWQQKQVKG